MNEGPVAAAVLSLLATSGSAFADTYPRQPLDVLHYDVSISFVPELAYQARTRVDVRLLAEGLTEIRLDLDGPLVDRVSVHGERLACRREGGRLVVDLARSRTGGEIVPVLVEYHGLPDGKGLRAGRSAHGDPMLFADNWPENARRWIPWTSRSPRRTATRSSPPAVSARRARSTTGGARRAGPKACRSRPTAWSSASPSSR